MTGISQEELKNLIDSAIVSQGQNSVLDQPMVELASDARPPLYALPSPPELPDITLPKGYANVGEFRNSARNEASLSLDSLRLGAGAVVAYAALKLIGMDKLSKAAGIVAFSASGVGLYSSFSSTRRLNKADQLSEHLELGGRVLPSPDRVTKLTSTVSPKS